MNPLRMVAIALIVGGVLALLYGGFSYSRQTQTAQIGSIELSVSETRQVNVPLWAGVAAVVAGGLLLVFGNRRS
jgi:TRAP-type C4-dicarboxylate transport system permease small subunit